MRKLSVILIIGLIVGGQLFAAGTTEAQAVYPTKDITVEIFSSQGGGTHTWCRFLSPLMEEEL